MFIKNFWRKFTIKIIIISIFPFGLKSQPAIYSDTEMDFIGRWIKWSGNKLYPNNNTSIALNDPYTHAIGFWDEPFTVDFYYSDNLVTFKHPDDFPSDNSGGWVEDLHDAALYWNTFSKTAKVRVLPLGADVDHFDLTEQSGSAGKIRKNVIFFSDDPTLFGGSSSNIPARLFYYKIFDQSDNCTNVSYNWNQGPILIDTDIGFNAQKKWYNNSHSVPISINHNPLNSVAAHEIGHALGLGHWPRNVKRILMNRAHGSKRKIFNRGVINAETEDREAINALYGTEGANNDLNQANPDPWFRAIPCDKFNIYFSGTLLMTGPNGEPFGGSLNSDVSPCDNCGTDPGEDGINCGPQSGCGVLCEDICSYNAENIVLTDYWIPMYDYTIAKNTVTLTASRGNISIPSGDFKYIKAGEYIDVKPSPFIFDTGISSDVEMVIGDCNCPDICTPRLPNVMTANCDGVNDFLFFAVNGASSYEFTVRNRNGTIVYSDSRPINYTLGNKIVNWAGQGNSGGMLGEGVYFYTLKLQSSCLGTNKEFSRAVTLLDPKDCNDDPLTKRSGVAELADEPSFEFYPNPVIDLLTITSQSAAISSIILHDMQGRKLEEWADLETVEYQIDLAKYGSNSFIVTVNTNNGKSQTKIITKK